MIQFAKLSYYWIILCNLRTEGCSVKSRCLEMSQEKKFELKNVLN